MKEILLIGNGPSCLNNEYGELINSHETVVRFNDFVTKSYEKFTGTKTDIWVKTFKSTKHNKGDFSKKLYVYPRVVNHNTTTLNQIKDDGYDIVPLTFHNKVDKIINENGIWATTGLVIIYYFISMGFKVKIHGFDFFKNGTHYYGDDSKMVGHRPDIEKKIVDELIKSGLVVVLKDE